MDLLDRFRSALIHQCQTENGDSIILGLSGGPDSVCLLDLMVRLRDECGFRLIPAHLHHGIRGDEADKDLEFCRTLCASYGLDLDTRNVSIPQIARDSRLSLEEAGRLQRYHFFLDLALHYGCRKVAVAHHRDDLAETVLMRLVRGAGPEGLSGITWNRPLVMDDRPIPNPLIKVIRPLLAFYRSEIDSYLNEKNLLFRTDQTNRDNTYLRNRIRNVLIPGIEKDYNPRIREALARTADILQEEEKYWNLSLALFLRNTYTREKGRLIYQEPQELAKMPLGFQRRAIRFLIEKYQGHLRQLDFEDVESIVKLISGQTLGKALELTGNLRVELRNEQLIFTRHLQTAFSSSNQTELPVPGSLSSVEFGGEFTVELHQSNPGLLYDIFSKKMPPESVCFDAEKLHGPLTVRSWKAGDRFQPLGLKGHKKVQDLFVNRKIPREIRNRVPLVCDSQQILWVTGIQPSEAAKVTAETRQVVRIQFVPEPDPADTVESEE